MKPSKRSASAAFTVLSMIFGVAGVWLAAGAREAAAYDEKMHVFIARQALKKTDLAEQRVKLSQRRSGGASGGDPAKA